MNFTKRDLKMIVLGFFACLLFEVIYNWSDSVESFKEGYNSVHPELKTK